jgi:membrane protease subunit (stomatin/prohibitin family)
MPFLLRAAIVGGGAYAVGRHMQRGRDQNAAQNEQISDLQSQQAQQAPAPPAAAPASQDDTYNELTKLKSLLDQGVLTQAEFDAQKQKILQGM